MGRLRIQLWKIEKDKKLGSQSLFCQPDMIKEVKIEQR